MRKILVLAWLIVALGGQAQDSLRVFTLDDFLSVVVRNHPMMQQAALMPEYARAELRMARGAFDPTFSMTHDEKEFRDRTYYKLTSTTLKVPTALPLDPKVTVDRHRGYYLNPSQNIPEGDMQISPGFSIPIGRGLFIDERRAILQQAKIYQDMAYAEQIKMANKLLLTVVKDYFEWDLNYQKLRLTERSIDIARELFERVLIDYQYGEAAVVDTLQAKIVYQTRQADYQKALFEFINAGLELSQHLWTPELTPLLVGESTIPDTLAVFPVMPESSLSELIEWARENHPEVLKLTGKVEQLAVEMRLNKEFLKPQVDLGYSFIDAPLTPQGGFESPEWSSNYKLGVQVYIPLLLRKERGKLLKTRILKQENEFELEFKRISVVNQVQSRFAELEMARQLTRQYRDMAEGYRRLFEAELLNLEVGESDLFKLNIQQDKYIESQMKYLDYLMKLEKTKAQILHDVGLPYLLLPVE
jgi:outer membrane protein TolC